MAAITTSVGICNLALLGHLGQDPITAIGEGTRSGELCNIFYETTRDALLRSHTWNFAIKYADLAEDTGESATIPFGYEHAYTLPTSPFCLKVIRTAMEEEGYADDYRVKGRFLYSNEDSVSIEYVGRVTSVGEYDALFIQLLAYDLAILMCMPLADNAALRDRLMEDRKNLASLSLTIDAQEGTPRETTDASGWLSARL